MTISQITVRYDKYKTELGVMVLLATYFVVNNSLEKVHFVLTLIGLVFFWRVARDLLKPAVLICLPMLLFVAVGTLHSLLSLQLTFETFKGVWYASRFPVYVIFGIFLARRLKSDNVLFGAIAIGSTALAVQYIWGFMSDPNLANSSRVVLRDELGAGSLLTGMTIIHTFVVVFKQKAPPQVAMAYMSAAAISVIAFMLADSRTLAIETVILLVFCIGIIPVRGFAMPIILLVLMLAFIVTTPLISLIVSQDTLFSLAANAPPSLNEVLPIDRGSMSEINNGWRGYETFQAFTQVYDGGLYSIVFGTGMHTSVELPFAINLGGAVLNEIPIFHNAFSFVVFRCGLVGVVLFFWQHYNLCRRLAARSTKNKMDVTSYLDKFACGLLVFGVVSTPSIAGLLGTSEIGGTVCVIIGYAIGRHIEIASLGMKGEPRNSAAYTDLHS